MHFKQMKKRYQVLWITILSCLLPAWCVPAVGAGMPVGWETKQGTWSYRSEEGGYLTDWFCGEDGNWYYFDSEGIMVTGWKKLDGSWYFFNTIHDGTYGKMMGNGWHWIDGYCYYLNMAGWMLSQCVTPDGFYVGEDGAWMERGAAFYEPGKGIMTTTAVSLRAGGSGGSRSAVSGVGGGAGNRTPGGQTGEGQGYPTNDSLEDKGNSTDDETEESGKDPDNVVNSNKPDRDLEDAPVQSTPSDAASVKWKVYFTEKGETAHQILPSQEGVCEEGSRIFIDFPQMLLGSDQYFYYAVSISPYQIAPAGAGNQKYYIEYEKGEMAPSEQKPNETEQKRLDQWLTYIKEEEEKFTGILRDVNQLLVYSQEECDLRLINLVSMARDANRHEIYVAAKGFLPSAAMIGFQFGDVADLSEQMLDSLVIDGETYVILRVGFRKNLISSDCRHRYEVMESRKGKCLEYGWEIMNCVNCGTERRSVLPVSGHKDGDRDGQCDICYETNFEEDLPEELYFREGDLQSRKIGDRVYLFRCVDEDYEDALGNRGNTALFLCEEIIRSDVELSQMGEKLRFGEDSQYKNSQIRNWLRQSLGDASFGCVDSYMGNTLSYSGTTVSGSFEQFSQSDFKEYAQPFQQLQDKIFCLSLEEAVKYKDILWKFGDGQENNPETQYSPYSKGYWLRTPQHLNKDGIYVVDLMDGRIRTASSSDTSMGIRPAITVAQSQ